MKMMNRIGAGLLMLAIMGCGLGQAQETTDTLVQNGVLMLGGTNISSLRSLSDDQLSAFVNVLSGTPTISVSDMPRGGITGTYWSLAQPGFPPLPGDTIGVDAWPMADGSFLLNDLGFGYSSTSSSGSMSMMAMGADLPSPGGSGGGGYSPDGLTNSYTTPDFGTNLCIVNPYVASGQLYGIGSNTISGVSYIIQSVTNLLEGSNGWQYEGTIVGSYETNWTPLSVPQYDRINLFIRLKSEQSSDGSGIPDWWEAQYGLSNVNPNAQDSAGDGYTIYQKYVLGIAPNTWVTPAAPQGFTVTYNANNNTVTFTWLPSSGNVTSYTISDSVGDHFTVSASATSLTVSTASLRANPFANGNIETTYSMVANYGSTASATTTTVPLETRNLAGAIVQGPLGVPELVLSFLPGGTAAIQLTEISASALNFQDTNFYITNVIVPISNFTNGISTLPNWVNANNVGPSWEYGYDWVGRTVGTNGSLGAAVLLAYENFTSTENDDDTVQLVPPYYDGRAQLKQNLIFQLRAASADAQLHFSIPQTNIYDGGIFGAYVGNYVYPASYAYAGFYQFSPEYSSIGLYTYHQYDTFDPYLPVEENCLFRNFAFTPADADANGYLTTGASYNGRHLPDPENDFMTLDRPLKYEFQTSWTTFPALLNTNTARWSFYDEFEGLYGDNIVYPDYNSGGMVMNNNCYNWFGLPYISANVAYNDFYSGNLATNVVLAGGETILPQDDVCNVVADNIYLETAQPKFRTVEYDFWPSLVWSNRGYVPPILPGSPVFSVTNTGQAPFIVGVGQQVQVVGYAKLEVTNSLYSGVYGYLGQYFDRAYTVDTNGNVTTNIAGVVSPYGNFLATQPGQTALLTMPDIDTGQRGTCMVYSVSMQLDKNHDGVMDTSFNGPDATSQASPMEFWCNNNYDRFTLDSDGVNFYDDSVLVAGCPYTPNTPTPDCNFKDGAGNRCISCDRDLQDFARLWVCGITTNLLAELPAGSTVTLNWGDVGSPNPANPTIDLFQAADADGGIGYLTNSTTAGIQTENFLYPCIGRLGPGQSIQLNASQFNGWAGNHFIWCGVSNGTGGLTLTIADGSGNALAQTIAYIQIVDIKQMYERWTIGDNPNIAPLTNALLGSENLPAGVPSFQYPPPTDTNTPYILYVHGWNMKQWEKDSFAESAFKRLYWQGYRGRFGVFRWPTDNGFGAVGDSWSNPLTDPHNYDNSEFTAWQSAVGLLNKLNNLNAEYPGHVYMLAHSMGNVVAGEALRLAGSGQILNTYIASQGAIPAHVYDSTVTNLIDYTHKNPSYPFSAPGHPKTPNIYGNRLAGNSAAVGRRINFYNFNDFALSPDVWCFDQELKPDTFVLSGSYAYAGSTNDPSPWNNFEFIPVAGGGPLALDIVNNIQQRYEVLAYAADPYSAALGSTPGVTTLSGTLDLQTIWPTDTSGHNYADHFWHSAEFRGDCWQEWNYWQTLLFSTSTGFNIGN